MRSLDNEKFPVMWLLSWMEMEGGQEPEILQELKDTSSALNLFVK